MSNVLLFSKRCKAKCELLPVNSEKFSPWTQMLTKVFAEQSHAEPDLTWATATKAQASSDLHITFLCQQFGDFFWAHSDACTSSKWIRLWLHLRTERKTHPAYSTSLFVVNIAFYSRWAESSNSPSSQRTCQKKKTHDALLRWHLQKEQTKMRLISDTQTKRSPVWKRTAAAIMS